MEKKTIIARFLKNGYQLESSAIDYFAKRPEEIETFIKKAEGRKRSPILTLEFVKDVLKKGRDFEIIKKFSMKEGKETISTTDCANSLARIYEGARDMLVGRVDQAKAISINKIGKKKEFVIIASVREKDNSEKTAVVEDLTGSVNVALVQDDFESVYENDIVALECATTEGGVEVKKVIWPDLPFNKTVKKSDSDVCAIFISDIHMDSAEFDKTKYMLLVRNLEDVASAHEGAYIFILGGISGREEDVKSFIKSMPENATKVFLKGQKDAGVESSESVIVSDSPMMAMVDGIPLLLCQGDSIYKYKEFFTGGGADVIKNLIKRRNIAPPIGEEPCKTTQTDQLITPPPSIFASGSFHKAESLNYKGATVLITGDLSSDPTFWVVDLKTREINKLAIS